MQSSATGIAGTQAHACIDTVPRAMTQGYRIRERGTDAYGTERYGYRPANDTVPATESTIFGCSFGAFVTREKPAPTSVQPFPRLRAKGEGPRAKGQVERWYQHLELNP